LTDSIVDDSSHDLSSDRNLEMQPMSNVQSRKSDFENNSWTTIQGQGTPRSGYVMPNIDEGDDGGGFAMPMDQTFGGTHVGRERRESNVGFAMPLDVDYI